MHHGPGTGGWVPHGGKKGGSAPAGPGAVTVAKEQLVAMNSLQGQESARSMWSSGTHFFFYLIPLSFSHLLSQAISFFLKIIIIIITHCYYLKQGLTLWPRLAFMDQPLGDYLSYVPPCPVSALLYVVVWCSCVCIFWHRCFSGCVVWSQKSALFLRQWLTLPTLPRTYWLGRGCWQAVSGSQLSLLPCTGAVSVPLHATTSASFSLGSGDGTHFLLLGRCALYRRRHRLSSSDGVGTGR